MISILIPIYNQEVVPLVKGVSSQCVALDIDFQILVFDDKSEEKYRRSNSNLSSEVGVNYVELSENLGRAKIRNRLGKMARYDWSIFLDGDSKIVSDNFIKQYVSCIGHYDVVVGGRVYQKDKPARDYLLHWKYGSKVESQPVSKRIKKPFLNFHSNNFMIRTDLFVKVLFDEKVEGYGYEDLLFAEDLASQNAVIHHIDNPILHDGLENNETFLEKTKKAVENLVLINKSGRLKEVRLSSFYTKLKLNGVLPIIMKFLDSREQKMISKIKSNQNLRALSFYKLLYYHNLLSRK